MTTKKQAKKRAQIDIGLRLFPDDHEVLARAVQLDAKMRGVFPSQNAFCVQASLAAARKVLKENDRTSE